MDEESWDVVSATIQGERTSAHGRERGDAALNQQRLRQLRLNFASSRTCGKDDQPRVSGLGTDATVDEENCTVHKGCCWCGEEERRRCDLIDRSETSDWRLIGDRCERSAGRVHIGIDVPRLKEVDGDSLRSEVAPILWCRRSARTWWRSHQRGQRPAPTDRGLSR